jgi:tetratricopeptide (TPR) repeat protein
VSVEPQSETYPGNPSLPVEVREKIVSAFRHSLDLFRDGKLDDCLIGCDFILKMDPRFAPARKLQEKAKNPRADVDVEELRRLVTASPAPTGPAPAAAAQSPEPAAVDSAPGGLDDLSLDSLSLDGPLPDFSTPTGETGLPFEPAGVDEPVRSMFTTGAMASEPAVAKPEGPSPEDEIAALLAKGDEALAAGGAQQAIEIWSRVFLIDIDNADAVTRIEQAREAMAAESHRIASALEQGQESFARCDLAAAKSQFDAVLALDSKDPAAPVPPPPPPAPVGPSPYDLSAVAPATDVLAEELEQSGPPGRRSWTLPRPKEASEAETAPTLGSRLGVIRVNRRTAMIGGAALAVIAIGLFFLLRPSGARNEAPAPPGGPSLAHATALFQEGKIAETTAELRRIPPSDPDYAKAQKLLASLTSAEPRPGDSSPASAPPPVAEAPAGGDPAALRAEAVRALNENRYIDAMKSFSLAAPHFEGDPTFAQEMAAASEKVSELTPAVKLYNDGEYETAIPILWRIYQNARSNQDAKSYLLRSYYNQGIAQLQNGLYEKAKESFGEVLALEPDDFDAIRHRQFAERYRSGELDLLAQIYVRYISPRP